MENWKLANITEFKMVCWKECVFQAVVSLSCRIIKVIIRLSVQGIWPNAFFSCLVAVNQLSFQQFKLSKLKQLLKTVKVTVQT